MKKSSARLSLVACLLIVCALHFLSLPTFSLSSGSTINVVFEFEKTLQLSISDPELFIEDLPPGTSDNTNEISVNVATNSESGFIMDAAVGERLRPSTRIPNIIDGETYFQSVGLHNTVTTVPAGSWGYSIDHGATYSGLPDYRDVHPSDIFIESHEAANMSLPFLVGATAADDQARGIYYTPITFRAVTRPTVDTIDTILYMQDLDEAVYASMKVEKQYQLIDKRDGKMYYIAKLKDDNVWMTQNLDFDLYDGIVLSPETSDVAQEITMDLTPMGRNYDSSTHYYYFDNYMYDQGDYYCPSGYCNRPTDLVPLDEIEQEDKNYHYALGNRYSYSAATADYFPQCVKYEIDDTEYNNCYNRYNNEYSGQDAETSICPAGWTLPSSKSGQRASLSDLGRAIGMSSSNSGMDYPIFAAPIYLVGNGYIYVYQSSVSNSINNGNNYAYYWTSTNAGSYNAYYLYAYLYTNSTYDNVTQQYHYYPYSGYFTTYTNTYDKYTLLTVRCVAKAPQYTVEYYMNDGVATTPYDTWKSTVAWSGNNKVKPKVPNRSGYKFLGWGTSPKTVEARYYPNEEIELDSYNVKLYAVWEELSDDDMQEGIYTFDAVLHRAGKTLTDGYYSMQDLSGELCEQVDVGSETTLRDSRDGKLYKVVKDQIAPDGTEGTCWMHNDLRLGSKTESYTLTPEDSDVTENFTIPAIQTYQYTDESTFRTALVMDNEDRYDDKGRPAGYTYNYNLLTAGYYAAHYQEGGNQVAATSICPKNWTLPRAYGQSYTNSEKQIFDNIEPTNLTNTYYYRSNYPVKYNNIVNSFYENTVLFTHSYNSTSTVTYRATKDFYNQTYFRHTYQNSGEVSVDSSSNAGSYAASVRCMIPIDYEMVNTTINYYINYSTSGSSSSSYVTQRASARSTDSRFYITINPQGINSRPGYQLLGWSETNGATVPDYYNGDIMELPISRTSIDLYAVWKKIEAIEVVSFDDAYAVFGKTKRGNYYAMQDITPEICDMVTDGQQGRLIDLRDSNVYWVTRVTSAYDVTHEGECWMSQNLDFEIPAGGISLTPDLSDVEDEVITRADFLTANDQYYGYVDGGDYYLPDGGLRFSERIETGQLEQFNALVSTNDLADDDEKWHYHLGSFYSWSTATGITDLNQINSKYRLLDVESSICPRGWTLPHYDYYSNTQTSRSYNALTNYILPATNAGYNNKLFIDPFYPSMAGYIPPTNDTTNFETIIKGHRLSSFGYDGYYWTANTSSERYPYSWYFYKNDTYSDYENPKNRYTSSSSYSSYYNFSLLNVRCVARGEN